MRWRFPPYARNVGRCQVGDVTSPHVVARCGLRGARVGEASNPEPPKVHGSAASTTIDSDDEALVSAVPFPTPSRVTCSLATWIWCNSMLWMLGDSKSWQTDPRFGAELSSQLTPPSCRRHDATGRQGRGQRTKMALFWRRRAAARRGLTPNSLAKEVGLAWSCWLLRLEVDGTQ